MKFNIKITDNETGEVLLNENTGCIFDALSQGDGKAKGMSIAATNTMDIVAAAQAAQEAVENILESDPKIKFAYMLTKALGKCEVIETSGGVNNE